MFYPLLLSAFLNCERSGQALLYCSCESARVFKHVHGPMEMIKQASTIKHTRSHNSARFFHVGSAQSTGVTGRGVVPRDVVVPLGPKRCKRDWALLKEEGRSAWGNGLSREQRPNENSKRWLLLSSLISRSWTSPPSFPGRTCAVSISNVNTGQRGLLDGERKIKPYQSKMPAYTGKSPPGKWPRENKPHVTDVIHDTSRATGKGSDITARRGAV